MTLGLIVAVSPDNVIGVQNKIPWHHPEDLKRFKALTTGTTIIMGRNTYDSIGKPLPNRRNIVITRRPIDGVECYASFEDALSKCEGQVWCIGGAQLYAEAMKRADFIDVTYVPERPPVEGAVLFPSIPEGFEAGPLQNLGALKHRVYTRVSA